MGSTARVSSWASFSSSRSRYRSPSCWWKGARASAYRPELYLSAATGALFAFGFVTVWYVGPYAVAGVISGVAWLTGQRKVGPSAALQVVVLFTTAIGIVAVLVGVGTLVFDWN
jgi:hypothetical protein